MTEFTQFDVKPIPGGIGRDFIREKHYTRSCHNGPMCWGLFQEERLLGVIAFATPSSENVRSSLFGPEHKNRVTELHRLHVEDGTPKNTESWFISRGLEGLHKKKPEIRGVISFADSTEGHTGVIYRASNAIYCGTTGKTTFYRDGEGRLRHPRQNGVNITLDMATERGWTPEKRDSKRRYVLFLGSKTDRKWARSHLLLKGVEYD